MNHSEKNVQNKILNLLKKLKIDGHPIYYERRQAGGFSYKKGLPDIYFVYRGLHYEVEVKSSIGELSSAQETWASIFKRNFIPHIVINNFKQFEKIINVIINNEIINYKLIEEHSNFISEYSDKLLEKT